MKYKFIFLISLWISSFCFGAQFEVEFFDVGQGGGGLLCFGKGPPLMYDYGSSCIPDRGMAKNIFKNNQLDKIANKILSNIPALSLGVTQLNVVISHGDEDHYSWIVEIFRDQNDELKIEREEHAKI